MTELPAEAVRDHHDRAREVYQTLATAGEYATIANNDHTGWYLKKENDDLDAIDAGYSQKGRVVRLDDDLDVLLDRLDRTLYAITSYKDPASLRRWEDCRLEDGKTEWAGEKPTPTTADLRAVPAWGDIDLTDELKERRGDLDAETRETIEAALEAYIDEYADLYGSRDAVYALDSVGGAYLFGAPEATIPIAEHFDDDAAARERVFDAFLERSNEWLAEAEKRVNDRVSGAGGVLDPDWVNNVNRQYKAPLTLHKSHAAVVTPIDTDAVEYDVTALSTVSDELVYEAEAWAAEFTATTHIDAVDSLVSELWPDEYATEDDWRAALDAWVEDEREQERAKRRRREKAAQRREERRDEYGSSIEGSPVTPHIHDIHDTLDNLDIEDVAEDTIVAAWNEDANTSDGARAFYPEWDPNCNGTANIVVQEKNIAVDTGDQNKQGGPVEMALYDAENWTWGDTADGEDWWRGLDALRSLGYDIPVYIPDATTTGDDGEELEKMPFWAVKKAAVALGVIPEGAFIDQENDDGETYEGFPGRETYIRALEAIEEVGLDHGRETSEEIEAANTLDELTDYYQNHEDDDPFSARQCAQFHEALGAASEETYEEYRTEAVQILEEDPERLDRHRELYRHEQEHGPVVVDDGATCEIVNSLRRTQPLLNFELNVDSFLKLQNGPKMANVSITPSEETETPFEKQLEPRVFNQPKRFRDDVLDERFSTIIETDNGYDDGKILDILRTYISRVDAPERWGTKQMGLFRGEFVTPNGVIAGEGWAEDPEAVFVERNLGAEREFVLEPEDQPGYDEAEVAEMLELLVQTRAPERFIPVLGWYYAAPFRPYIVDEAASGAFNLLHVTGKSGTGKTTTLKTLARFFGMSSEPFSCTGTVFPIMAALASSNGVPMWFDEYKPAEMQEWWQGRLHELLRKASTGGIEQRGTQDQETKEYHLRAPAVVSGEEGFMGSAEQRRSIQTIFRDEPTHSGTEYARRFKELIGDAAETEDGDIEFNEANYDFATHALAYYSRVTETDREAFREAWREAKRYSQQRLQEWGKNDLDDLEKQGLQTIVFGFRQLREFAEDVGADMTALPTEEDLDDALRRVADVGGTGRESHLDRYVQLLSRVALEGDLEEDTHYRVVNAGTPDEEIRINVDRAHDKVTRYAKTHDINEDLFAQAKDYKTRFREAEEEDGTYVVSYSQNTPPIKRAVGIDPDLATEHLEDFAWPDAGDLAPNESSDDTDGGDGADPIASIESDEHGLTVEARVEDVETDTPDQIAEKATVADTSGEIIVTVWADAGKEPLTEGECYRFGNLYSKRFDGTVELNVNAESEVAPLPAGTGLSPAVEGDQQSLDAPSEDGQAAATDGGESDLQDIDDATGTLARHLGAEYAPGEKFRRASLAGELPDLDPEDVERGLSNLGDRGTVIPEGEGEYMYSPS